MCTSGGIAVGVAEESCVSLATVCVSCKSVCLLQKCVSLATVCVSCKSVCLLQWRVSLAIVCVS